jgi:hypothetical protein
LLCGFAVLSYDGVHCANRELCSGCDGADGFAVEVAGDDDGV